MKIPEKLVERLCSHILERLKEKNLLKFKVPEPQVLNRLIQAIKTDLDKETVLDREVRALMDPYRGAIDRGEVDEHKVYQMIRKQLIKQKNWVI